MSNTYRLYPTAEQEQILLRHCADARYVWNLAVEQDTWWQRSRGPMPTLRGRTRQLTEARADNPWLADGSVIVQQQALHDFDAAMQSFFRGGNRRPGWRKAGRDEGFRITNFKPSDVRRLNGNWGHVRIPKVGLVRFRWSRGVPEGVRSFRVSLDCAGRWHVGFTAIPDPIPGPGTGDVVGIDRGVAISAALSTGEMLTVPGLSAREQDRLRRLQRKLTKAKRGSNRRGNVRLAAAKLRARETSRRRDWVEKTSTDIARRFDVIRVEDLKIKNMTRSITNGVGPNARQKAGMNRRIAGSGWGLLVKRLQDKAPGRVEKINPAYTSRCCSACGHVAKENRESQAVFRCVACNFACNADVNAAINIAAGHAVTARGGSQCEPVNREPQLLAS